MHVGHDGQHEVTACPVASGVHGIVEKLLAKRGLSGTDLESFLDPSLKHIARAAELPGVSAAAEAILPFIRERRPIVVFGDYDCDGVCASAILVKTLRRLGACAEAFLPNRFTEGYGMTPQSVARLLDEHPDVALAVTVDCGITSEAEIRVLKDRGVAVVVTDHHLPPETLPMCDALVDPKIPAQRSSAEAIGALDLCGAGIAFFLASALVSRATAAGLYGGEKFGAPLLVLAGLATVVDIVPLLGQNRILAANALRAFRSAPVGLQELLLRAQRRPVELTSRDFGFLLGPRINAAGRMASAEEAYDLLMAEDREEARCLAQRVDAHNAERKTVENRMTEQALAQISEESPAAIMVGGDATMGWHTGVCGIVASRLQERYGVPTAVAVDGRGSVRAPEGYDVHAALTACSDFLERFGGHAAAGGFTVKEGRFAAFREAFTAVFAAQRAEGRATSSSGLREPELWVTPDDLTLDLHAALAVMEPFGEGNPEPILGLRGVTFSDIRLMGENGRHAAFAFADRRIPRATWWGHGEMAEQLRARSMERFDIIFTLDVSDWNGEEPHLELRLCGIAPTRREKASTIQR